MPRTSRRAVLGALAALPLAGLPVAAFAAADPVYAAIEAHTRTFKENRRLSAHLRVKEAEMKTGTLSHGAFRALEEALGDSISVETRAFEVLLATAPTTAAGARAWITHIAGPCGYGGPCHQEGAEVELFALVGALSIFAQRLGESAMAEEQHFS